MQVTHRALLAVPVALALLVLAPPALAISDLSQAKCLTPSEADDDLRSFFEDFDASQFEENDCRRFCTALGKLCLKNAKSRAKCIKTDDRFAFKLDRELCDGDPECEESVAAQKDQCKDQLKADGQNAKEQCGQLVLDCLDDCPGTIFPDPGPL